MAISYRTAGAWGAGIGRNLHPDEVDENFYEIIGLIDAINTALPGTTVSISSIYQTGTDLYVTLTDASIFGPFAMPRLELHFKGDWLPSTGYFGSDVVTNNGSTYLVQIDHTSGLTFDPGANDGMGHNFYGLILTNATNSLPDAGTTAQVLEKIDGTDFNVQWASSGIKRGGTIGQIPIKNSSTDFDWGWSDAERGSTVATVGTTTFTPTISNKFNYIRLTNGSGCVVTIPLASSQAFAIGDVLEFRIATSAPCTFVGALGVVINIRPSLQLLGAENGATVAFKKVAGDVWDASGGFAPV